MIVLLWLSFAVVAAVAASSRGRNGFGWFVLSVLLSPLVGLILVLVMPNLKAETQHTELMRAFGRAPPPLPQAERWQAMKAQGLKADENLRNVLIGSAIVVAIVCGLALIGSMMPSP